ncbi:ROK family protein [Sphingobacterium sp. BIGb0165]|uniref:ROK family protein n=1 Tax=Sphingobacterium sp. BIGb0165 TaxID=2940615 RepID=UPI0021695FFE|nr:ROK family protein [Sphingobacterium sp. BIGb0165]MCS4225810.1 putative NBD/HSP70 family sugar kinase [Sphingobacterium sp. BIGb0165]
MQYTITYLKLNMNPLHQVIVKTLYFSGTLSIAELSKKIGKSIPITTNSIQYLLEKKIITCEGLAPSTGGRRATNYSLNGRDLPFILAITIDQYSFTITLLDLSNNIIKESSQETINLQLDSNLHVRILERIDHYLADQLAARILIVGITMPGFVNSAKGINTSYSEQHPLFNIRDIIQQHLKRHAYIENDSAAIAIAEHNFGKAKDTENALVINLNWGVGMGMILKNELFRGSVGFAGEFSHIPLSDQNKLCSCGKKGCLEVEASLLAAIECASLKLDAGEVSILSELYQLERKITIDQLMEAAIDGDQLAINSFSRIGYMLGKGIATLIHIVNPEKVIISGHGARIGQILLPQIQAAVVEFSINRLSKHTSIEISSLLNVQLMGTASIAILALNGETLNIN